MSKLLDGKEMQIKVDPAKLERASRKELVGTYFSKQSESVGLLMSANSLMSASIIATLATALVSAWLCLVTIPLIYYATKRFYHYGYEKALVDDWESKIMIRMDK